jgi:hypothetical protein
LLNVIPFPKWAISEPARHQAGAGRWATKGEVSPCNWKIREIRNFRANEHRGTKLNWPDRTGSEQDR